MAVPRLISNHIFGGVAVVYNLNKIEINVEGSDVTIQVGDIFQQSGLKAIAFNEYFDTQVDNKVIAEGSLNGIFIKEHLDVAVAALDAYIESYAFETGDFPR